MSARKQAAGPTKVVIIGAGGFAREVLWLLRSMGPQVEPIGFLDDAPSASTILGLPVLGPIQPSVVGREVHYVWGVGSPRLRLSVVERLGKVPYFTAWHPRAERSEYVQMGEGCVVCTGSVLTTQVTTGRHVAVNLNVTIGHDAVVGDYCQLNPGVHVSGGVVLEPGVDVGTGAVIIPGITVGAWSVIGAGAVVTRDLPDHVVAVGVPARVISTVVQEDANGEGGPVGAEVARRERP